ncbi:hypothetical protein HPP92_006579 [Vanilla planifolia]|uniref:Uncharacterized protein n=1 Tax=Vanilla planifolia TaxID=51239 RepID=A0A835VE91_VANPL|nr:hypothetical protein HPP92_006579 [Vanilla planifolia]
MRERDLVEEEAVRLRNVVRRRRKELRSRMAEVEREESERKRMVNERANARCKYENDIVTDTATRDASSPLLYQVYGSPRSGTDLSLQGTYNQLLERQFVATEDALNKAAEAKSISQKLVKRLHGNGEVQTTTLHSGVQSQNLERNVAGLKASINTLTSEVQCLNKLCLEWKEVEDSLRKKWKKIEEFDSRRSELESTYTAFLRADISVLAWPGVHILLPSLSLAPAAFPSAAVRYQTAAQDLTLRESILP